jgi:hypothetical protein
MAEKIHTHMLPSGNVIDRSIFVALSADKMAEAIAKVAGNGLLVVDDASAFFTTDNLIQLIAKKDPKSALVNEKVNAFTNDQLKMLLGVQNAQPAAAVVDDGGVIVGKAPVKPLPILGYPFAVVPANWSVGANISLGPNKIKRKVKNINGDGTQFFVATKSYKALCEAAILYWAGIDNKNSIVIQCGGQNEGPVHRTATFGADYVACGFNKLRRYELEQVAKYRGWFPANLLQQAAA